MDWKQLLGSITTSVDEELRLRNAYLAAENRILRQQIGGRVLLTDGDRKVLAGLTASLFRPMLCDHCPSVARARKSVGGGYGSPLQGRHYAVGPLRQQMP